MVYDKYGEKKTVAEKYVTVKKNKYTIKGLSSGRIRKCIGNGLIIPKKNTVVVIVKRIYSTLQQ